MKKFTAMLLTLTMVLSFAACGSKNEQPKEPDSTSSVSDSSASVSSEEEVSFEVTKDPTREAPFVIGFDKDDMPFSYLNEQGELVGFGVDVAREACQRCGWEMMAEPIDWNDRASVLAEGTVDCVWGQATEADIYQDESDNIWMTFGEIYVDATTVINANVETLPELAGKIVEADPEAAFAVEGDRASQWGKTVWENASVATVVESAEAAYRDLFAGKCDAVLINGMSDAEVDFDQFEAETDEDGYTLKTLYSSQDDETSETLYFRSAGACFANYNDDYDRFSEVVYAMAEDGTIQALMAQWDNTPWGSLTRRFSLYEYSDAPDLSSEEDEWEEEDEDYGELTEDEIAELFGDESVIEITDEDYLEVVN